MKKIAEIMAPAGNFESLEVAIQAGADSVYFGVTQLNMRAGSSSASFALKDIEKIVERCKKAKVKTYIAVNTLLYDHDMEVAKKIINSAKEFGVDAVIAFDFAVLQYAQEISMPAHISVQFSVSNYEALKFFAPLTNRVVLARELTLEQIKAIHEKIQEEQLMGNEGRLMEIEAFAHGALCVAQSGRCYMSLFTDNASANRGVCRQNCRAQYKVTDVETGKELVIDNHYVMSASDICTIDFLDKLIDAGVSVLKIEGRGRSPEYVSIVVSTYKKALKDIEKGNYTQEKIENYYKDLKKVFNRGLSRGNYYLGQELGSYSGSYGSQAQESKEYIGEVTNYFGKIYIAEMRMDSGTLACDDEIYVIGETTGILRIKIQELRIDNGEKRNSVEKGGLISFPSKEKLRRKDRVYKIVLANREK
ncbi:MAG: U32 family peptidase [Candidatus Moraniibacteriota bacterium]|nr:MAG: U32 family peptidase [Candidatus Moranbacteria bacterium]